MDYQLWHGDCLEEMSRIESGSVDMICADLPYGTTACGWDTLIPFEPLWKQYKRVIKKNGAIVLFGSQPFTTLLIANSPYFGTNKQWFRYELIWCKNLLTGMFNANKMPMRGHENILVFYRELPIYNPQKTQRSEKELKRFMINPARVTTKNSVYGDFDKLVLGRDAVMKYPDSKLFFDVVNGRNSQKLPHPTQKPVALLSYLIKTYTNEGETVFDNTFGSCSTGEAALRTGRRFIGIEKDLNYFEIGKTRMERVAAELRGELNHLPMFQEAVYDQS